MRAGAGKSEIILKDDYLEIENFAVVHKTLNARALVIESGRTLVILSLEITSLPNEEAEEFKDLIARRYGVKKEGIWICVTHTFSAPHLLPDQVLKEEEKIVKKAQYRECLRNASLEAVSQAFAGLQPVTAGFGSGYCDINTNRDVELKDGWWIGEGGPGLADKTVSVVRFDREDKSPLAILFHYGIQSSVLDGSTLSAGGKAVSPDVAGVASDYIEKQYDGGTVGLFLIGAAGDQAPVQRAISETFVYGERIRTDRQEEGFGICERLGSMLGEVTCHIANRIKSREVKEEAEIGRMTFRVPGKEMERDLKKLHPTREFPYTANGEAEVLIEVMRIGELALVGVKPELNCISGLAVKACSPFEHTLVCTMVNGGAKYMADRTSYDRITYEAMNSPFGRGAAELLTRQAGELLERMASSKPQK